MSPFCCNKAQYSLEIACNIQMMGFFYIRYGRSIFKAVFPNAWKNCY